MLRFKQVLKRYRAVTTALRYFRRWQLHASYEARREMYFGSVQTRDRSRPDDAGLAAELRDRMRRRGYAPPQRAAGDIHTFAAISNFSWHHHLLPDLRRLGPVSLFDYTAYGFQYEALRAGDRDSVKLRSAMNRQLLPALRAAHRERPVDWVFFYAAGFEYLRETLSAITDELGIPLVCMCLDDKQSWAGRSLGGQRPGQVDIAPHFDLCWSSARVACEWYLAEGALPIYMPEGVDVDAIPTAPALKSVPVSFVGRAYGERPAMVDYLRKHGIDVRTFGKGWGPNTYAPDPYRVFQTSRINLGIGYILNSNRLTNVKGRDFELPAAGGGPYLTTFNADLAQHFVVGREILCYHSREEMLELIRYYLARPEEADAIARRGRERCLREHRWLHRYLRICGVLGILSGTGDPKSPEGVASCMLPC